MTIREYVSRQFRRWRNSPNCLLGVLVLTIVLGCTMYMYIFPWNLLEKNSEVDYYDESFNYLRKNKLKKLDKFQPNLFKTYEQADKLLTNPKFEFRANVPKPESWCKPRSNKIRSFLLLVLSLAKNERHRILIRNTWGSLSRIRNWNIKLVFVIGGKSEFQAQGKEQWPKRRRLSEGPMLGNEIYRYKDIIMGNFFEDESTDHQVDYHMMGYKWALTYCSNAEYILWTLDTTFVDTFQVVEMINYALPRDTLTCEINWGNAKLHIQNVAIKADHQCKPHAMLLSMDVVEKLYLYANGIFGNENFNATETSAMPNLLSLKVGERHVKNVEKDDYEQLQLNIFNEIRISNLAYKFLYVSEVAFRWGRNGKNGTDQKLPWTFVILPKEIDDRTKRNVRILWKKITYVSSQVFEFKLSPRANMGEEFQSKIQDNFKKAVFRLEE